MSKNKKKMKPRNPIAQDLHTNGRFAPKTIASKKSKLPRKAKYKSNDENS